MTPGGSKHPGAQISSSDNCFPAVTDQGAWKRLTPRPCPGKVRWARHISLGQRAVFRGDRQGSELTDRGLQSGLSPSGHICRNRLYSQQRQEAMSP